MKFRWLLRQIRFHQRQIPFCQTNAATDHHALAISCGFNISDQPCKRTCGAVNQLLRLLVTLPGARENSFRIRASQLPLRCRCNAATRSNRFHATCASTAADWAVWIGKRMPDMPRQTARAGKQFAAAHYTAANAGGNGDKDHIGYIAIQRLKLRPCCGLRVVNGNGRQIGKLFQRFD